MGSEHMCTLVQGDPQLLLADPSKSRPLSLNHIPWACSLQSVNSGTRRWLLFSFESPRRREGSQMGSSCPGPGALSPGTPASFCLCASIPAEPDIFPGRSTATRSGTGAGSSSHSFLLPSLAERISALGSHHPHSSQLLAEAFIFGDCWWDGSQRGCLPRSPKVRRLGKFR